MTRLKMRGVVYRFGSDSHAKILHVYIATIRVFGNLRLFGTSYVAGCCILSPDTHCIPFVLITSETLRMNKSALDIKFAFILPCPVAAHKLLHSYKYLTNFGHYTSRNTPMSPWRVSDFCPMLTRTFICILRTIKLYNTKFHGNR
jgi:hypothetical protein